MDKVNTIYLLGGASPEMIRYNQGKIMGVFHNEVDALNHLQQISQYLDKNITYFTKKMFIDGPWGGAEEHMHFYQLDEEGYVIPTTIDSEEYEYAVTIETTI